jgi:hypothetical protein
MPDFQTSLPTVPYDPEGGMKMLSGILGIQSRKLDIQRQQQDLQTSTANAQLANQQMGERQRIVQMMSSGKDDKGQSILDANGQPDPAKVIPALGRMAPLTGQDLAQNIIKTVKDNTGLQAASADLDMKHRQNLMGIVQSAANDPTAKAADINGGIDQYVSQHPEAGNTAGYLKSLVQHIDTVAPQNRPKVVQTIASHLQPGEPVSTQGTPTSVDTGPTIQPGVTAPAVAGGGFTPSGTPIAKAPGPTDLPAFRASQASAVARATGTAGSDIDRANEVAGLQQSSAAAIPLTERIDQLSREINSGHLAAMISKAGNYLGFSSVNEARSQLNKDLGQVKALAIQHSGSDSRAATVLEGYPTDTTPENTTHAAMDYIRGAAKQNLARGKLLSQYQASDPEGLKGFQAADNVLSRTTNPLMHEFLSLKPQDQVGFYRRNFSTKQEALEFRDEVNALKKHTNVIPSQ